MKTTSQKKTTASTREFLRNFAHFVEQGQTVTILKHGKPVGVFSPPEVAATMEAEEEKKQRRIRFEELKKATFKGGKTLSNNIDEIVYGIGR